MADALNDVEIRLEYANEILRSNAAVGDILAAKLRLFINANAEDFLRDVMLHFLGRKKEDNLLGSGSLFLAFCFRNLTDPKVSLQLADVVCQTSPTWHTSVVDALLALAHPGVIVTSEHSRFLALCALEGIFSAEFVNSKILIQRGCSVHLFVPTPSSASSIYDRRTSQGESETGKSLEVRDPSVENQGRKSEDLMNLATMVDYDLMWLPFPQNSEALLLKRTGEQISEVNLGDSVHALLYGEDGEPTSLRIATGTVRVLRAVATKLGERELWKQFSLNIAQRIIDDLKRSVVHRRFSAVAPSIHDWILDSLRSDACRKEWPRLDDILLSPSTCEGLSLQNRNVLPRRWNVLRRDRNLHGITAARAFALLIVLRLSFILDEDNNNNAEHDGFNAVIEELEEVFIETNTREEQMKLVSVLVKILHLRLRDRVTVSVGLSESKSDCNPQDPPS